MQVKNAEITGYFQAIVYASGCVVLKMDFGTFLINDVDTLF